MFRKMRELHGTLTDVYGARRVHRLSLMVNRRGDIRTIYCVPCGPLTYLDPQSGDESESESDNSNIKEDEYSKVRPPHTSPHLFIRVFYTSGPGSRLGPMERDLHSLTGVDHAVH